MSQDNNNNNNKQHAPAAWLEPATECLPTWSCDNEYYNALVEHEIVYIKTDPVKGKGLFARRDVAADEHVLVETALICAQNLDDFNSEINVCGSCLKGLETPRDIVRRLAGSECAKLVPKKMANFVMPAPIACTHEDRGCTMAFCNERCRDDAIRKHHYVSCKGRMSEEGKKAFDEFREGDWVHNGVDLSDTVFLAFRFICFALTRHRLHRLPLPLAFFPVGQLIKAPMVDFSFTYLLTEEFEEAEDKAITAAAERKKKLGADGDNKSDAAAAAAAVHPAVGVKTGDEKLNNKKTEEELTAQRWRMFVETKNNTRQHPALQFQLSTDDPDKVEFVRKGIQFVQTITSQNEAEKAFFTEELWSNLMGAVLLNGQERAPNSCFSSFMKAWKTEEPEKVKEFVKTLRQSKSEVTVKDFDTSSNGQGIYTVGSCFNHSCSPNLQIHYAGDDEMLCAVAMRDVKKDEELFISYIDEAMPLQKRQHQLFEHYLFTCACTKCTEEIEELKTGKKKLGSEGAAREGSRPQQEEKHVDAAAAVDEDDGTVKEE